MGCVAHQINTVMKTVMKIVASDAVPHQVTAKLKAVKHIVRIFKQSQLSGELRDGKTLIKEIESRFASTPAVVERFYFLVTRCLVLLSEKGPTPSRGPRLSF